MTLVDERAYDFRTAAHWAAGARDGLRADGDTLAVGPRLVAKTLPGTARVDAGALLATDPDGRLQWLRPRTRDLVHLTCWGVTETGVLSGRMPPRRLAAGPALVWLLAGGRPHRYRRTTLQRLTPPPSEPGWRISALTGAMADGVWLIEGTAAGHRRLRRLDCWGRTCGDPVALDTAADTAIASSTDRTRLVTLDPGANTVSVRDAATGAIIQAYALDPAYHGGPVLLAVDDRIHLLGRDRYQTLNLTDGGVEEHQRLRMPPGLGRPTGLAATADGPVVSCTGGLARIVPHDDDDREPGRRSTFITPALVSPLGVRSGWNRAEADVALPAGTAIEMAWAATDDAWLIEQAAALLAGPASAGRTEALDRLLPWRTGAAVTYRGTGTGDVERLAVSLAGITETTLWLRLWLITPPGRTPPRLHRLRVRYPDRSLLDDLPALYREQPRSADQLRRILAPYEVLLDGLDETLSGLPQRLDPGTAGDDWTPYLLSWLGFPPLADLPAERRRALLTGAGKVLAGRGTRGGLELLLTLVTGGSATVTDTGDEPAGWFLGTSPARLGHDTVALAQLPRPARAGALALGDTPIGHGCPDPGRMLAHRAGIVTIELAADPAGRRTLAPIIDRLLPFFVPAHCRVRVRWTGAGEAGRSRLLDVDLRLGPERAGAGPPPYDSLLHGDTHWRLGDATRLGHWPLPLPELHSAVLDEAPGRGARPRLQ